MRALPLALALLALPLAAAAEPWIVLLDWQEGHAVVGTTRLVASPLADRYAVEVPACYPWLLLDLLYEPPETGLVVEGVGRFALTHDFLVEVWRGDDRLSQVLVTSPGYGHRLGHAPDAGGHEVRVSLANGANVTYDARVRAGLAQDDPACNPPV